MNTENAGKRAKGNGKRIAAACVAGAMLFAAGAVSGFLLRTPPVESAPAGYAADSAYEYMVAAAAWQMSAEAHALMMQGFHIAGENVTEMARLADREEQGYCWVEEQGQAKLYRDGKRVCVVCDIDDTLVDGVHYTANILGEDGEWTNKAFTDFVQSEGCTALPGAVAFAEVCMENGVALFYVTNRYDQGYKVSEEGYAGEEGYRKADGTVIGSSTCDIFGSTMYDITMENLDTLGFPTNDPAAAHYWEDAVLIVNDTKLNGSSKENIRQTIAQGGELRTGERTEESAAYPETVDLATHHIAMLLGDDLNDISQAFSDSENAVERVALTVENMDKWGAQWIVFPNSVYGSAANFAAQYGYPELFNAFDYTREDNDLWEMYG